MMRKKPELLSPAGDMEKLKMAVAYGADAVYLAGTSFGMRSFAGNFSPEELPLAVAYAHDHGVRVHVTVNTMPRSGEVDALPAHLERLNDAGVDALILADLGAFTLAPGAEAFFSIAGDGNIEIASGVTLEEGATYRLTLDVTAGKDNPVLSLVKK